MGQHVLDKSWGQKDIQGRCCWPAERGQASKRLQGSQDLATDYSLYELDMSRYVEDCNLLELSHWLASNVPLHVSTIRFFIGMVGSPRAADQKP